ncbi:MAG: phage Gp37/Gp68 family protein [Deltaproteobacteria bacterium]|nr:phage Gp37/Gp68 family protein [Deltaproteobacteria bacterium]
MGENTIIEWATHTWNVWIGCSMVSAACEHCYAAEWDRRFHGGKHWGVGAPRLLTSVANRRLPFRWNRKAMDRVCSKGHPYPATYANLLHGKCYSCGERWENMPVSRPRVFVNSLSDWLDAEVPSQWRVELLDVIEKCQRLDFILLSKRPESWSARLHECASRSPVAARWLAGEPPANVWVGTTVEGQGRANERIPELLSIPARVRFLSCEPLLGAVSLRSVDVDDGNSLDALTGDWSIEGYGHSGYSEKRIHWVIAGGESGPKARPMHPDWVRSLRDQCDSAGVPFFFKQWGGASRVGKRAAGRLLDGSLHNAFPEVAS